MRTSLKLGAIVALLFTLVAVPLRNAVASDDEGYSFKVKNTTEETIKKLLASEDGKTYGSFDIGSKGIAPGKSMTLKWDKATDGSGCEWYFKAVFDDGEESEVTNFNFCEDDLELEF
jgi:hypothetical protein